MYYFILFTNLLTILLSIVIFVFQKRKILSTPFISLFLMSVALIAIIRTIVFFEKEEWIVALFFHHFSFIYFLVGPLLFLYVRSNLVANEGFKKIYIFHFFPALFILINNIPYFLFPFESKIEFAKLIKDDIINVVKVKIESFFLFGDLSYYSPFLFLIYGFISLYLLIIPIRTGTNFNLRKFRFDRISKIWVVFICVTTISLCFFYVVLNFNFLYYKDKDQIIFFAGVQAFLLMLFPLSLIFTPQILYGFIFRDSKSKIPQDRNKQSITFSSQKLTLENIAEKIELIMVNDKPFLSADFSFDDLVVLLAVPKNLVQRCLTEHLNTKFTDLRSHYRIRHAKELLCDTSNQNITIEAIGFESGFTTRSSFYRAFKEQTGITPKEFVSPKDLS
jgi:AraC-like DNA-binding protein